MTTKSNDPILPSDRDYLLARRQALLIELGAIERRLNLPRTIVPKHQQQQQSKRPPSKT